MNQIVADYIRARGFEVPVFGSFNEPNDALVAAMTPASIRKGVETHPQRRKGGRGIRLVHLGAACRVCAEIEKETGMPITSSNHAMAWHALRLAGVE